MDSTRAPESRQSGIALFMVIASISILSILVTEFAYIAQVNKKVALDGLDQLRAHYLAKSGLKLSLLRLKAYQNVKGVVGGGGGGKGGGVPGVPKQILEKIWSFPFFYPIPTSIPGLSQIDKDRIEKFQKASGLEGKFSANIESESAQYNLNMILAAFVPPTPAPSASPSPSPSASPAPTPTPAPNFDPDAARKSLGDYLFQILNKKIESDPEFANEYRDLRLEDLVEAIVAWADHTVERRSSTGKELIPMKRSPFYSLSELHMVPGMDDKLYDLFAPALTVNPTPGINVNMMKEPTLKALVPQMTAEEVKDFFKFRDSDEEDNYFKDADSFFKYIQSNVAAFRNNQSEVTKYREGLEKRNIRIVVDETDFRITIQAKVNNSTRLIEARVALTPPKNQNKTPSSGDPKQGGQAPRSFQAGTGTPPKPDPGLRVTFMRIL